MAIEIVFSKKLRESDIKCGLAVPTEALNHISPPGVENIKVWDVFVRDLAGDEWTFCCCTNPENHPKPAFTTGWLSFVQAKELKIGDQVILYKQKDGAGVVQYTIEAKRCVFRLYGHDIWVPVENLNPLLRRSTSPLSSAPASFNMAMEIVFSRILSEPDIKCGLTVPTEALNHISPPGVENIKVWDVFVRDLAGCEWTFCCCTNPDNHPKPAFITGWLSFVRAKELKIGDQVILYKQKDGAGVVQYIIEARRKVCQIFGQDYWVPVEELNPQSDAASCMEVGKPNKKWIFSHTSFFVLSIHLPPRCQIRTQLRRLLRLSEHCS